METTCDASRAGKAGASTPTGKDALSVVFILTTEPVLRQCLSILRELSANLKLLKENQGAETTGTSALLGQLNLHFH